MSNQAYDFKLDKPDQQVASFTAPNTNEVKTMHFILAVSDEGQPSLTRYEMVIVNVMP